MVSTGLFNEYLPRTYNAVQNAEVGCRSAYKYGGLGAIQTLWGDTGNSQFMVMEYEPVFVFGATAWNPENFQFEYVLDYLDKYIFKAENCSVSRTIADLEEARNIEIRHLNEAICYRNVDEKFWGGIAE